MSSENKHSVIIIGGGISGLSAAFWLKQEGIDPLLLERQSRAGGLIKSEKVKGYLLDYAANCVFNYLPEVNFLCQSLGLGPEQILRQEAAKKRYLVKDGRPVPVPMDIKGLIKTDLWSLKGKLRLMAEPFIPRGPEAAEESVAQFISRRFGKEIFERSIEPYVAGTLAGDAERACVKSTFSQFSSIEKEHGSILKGAIKRKLKGVRTSCAAQVFSFRNGMESLTKGLAAELGDSLISDTCVESIERVGTKWVARADLSGRKESFEAEAIILATPAYEAARLLKPLSGNLFTALGGIDYSPMVAVFLGFKREMVDHPLDGIGCLFPKKEKGFNTLGSLWSSTFFSDRSPDGEVLFTNYLAGARNPAIFEKSDDEVLSLALDDLRRVVGLKGEASFVKIVRHAKGLPQYNLGHKMILEKLDKELGLIPGLHVTGNYLNGVSVRACISQGKELAEKVAGQLKEKNRSILREAGRTAEPKRPAGGEP
jgi:oxygen-dependent protoporphyrinogen oxidase